jgi:hypothetical protein
MNYSFFSRIRDCFLLCSLLFLLKAAYDRNYSFLCEHKKSIIHELDRSFIEQIYTAQRQAHFLEEHNLHADAFSCAIADIKSRLATIEEKYKTNSPGLVLLGPIGSAAIVAKEEQLQQKLLAAINDLSKIFYTINESQETFQPAQTVDSGLDVNKQLLRTLTI